MVIFENYIKFKLVYLAYEHDNRTEAIPLKVNPRSKNETIPLKYFM